MKATQDADRVLQELEQYTRPDGTFDTTRWLEDRKKPAAPSLTDLDSYRRPDGTFDFKRFNEDWERARAAER